MAGNSTHSVCLDTVGWLGISPPLLLEELPSELPNDPRQLVKLGEVCLKSRLVSEAERCFIAAMTIDPSFTIVHYWLGYLYGRQGRYEQAALELRECLSAQPRNGHAYAELGLVYFKLGHVREARALWQQGLLLASCNDQPLNELLEHMSFCVTLDGEDRVIPNLCYMATLAAEKDTGLAYSYLERAYALEPFNPAIFIAFAAVFSADGRDDEAGLAWEEAVRLSPKDPDLQAKSADYYLSQGKGEEAKKRAEKAVGLAPHNALYRLLLARAEKRLGNLEIAERHLRAAHKLEPEQASINFELGHLLWCHGKKPTAFSFLAKASRAGHNEAKTFLALINVEKGGKRLLFRADKGGTAFEQTAY